MSRTNTAIRADLKSQLRTALDAIAAGASVEDVTTGDMAKPGVWVSEDGLEAWSPSADPENEVESPIIVRPEDLDQPAR
jgi:hypothetical protein